MPGFLLPGISANAERTHWDEIGSASFFGTITYSRRRNQCPQQRAKYSLSTLIAS